MLWLDDTFEKTLPRDGATIDYFMALDGEVVRHQDRRRTVRAQIGAEFFYVKTHRGARVREILKNLFYLRLPVIGARTEWTAIQRFRASGIPTVEMVAYGAKGRNPLTQRSLVVTRALEDTIALDRYCEQWRDTPPAFVEKRALVDELAAISRRMLLGGMNHRDYYLGHFLLARDSIEGLRRGAPPRVYLIDLHRVQIRGKTPRRWLVKDLGSLYFSVMHFGITRRDLLRFIVRFTGRPLRHALGGDCPFWSDVERRAIALYRKMYGHAPKLP
ncbi:MAG: lipopolysaccharide core heptose(I) kinase RfaP [Chromatiales bacterium]|nr:lipopolysaccharide core heptose(I) kinase RfaP [Chromatiales bacterium]